MRVFLFVRDGFIQAIGFDSDIAKTFDRSSFDTVIDASGKCVVPGEQTTQPSDYGVICSINK
jgi:imidazolonepropionase-like amidohydrolase